MKTKTYLQTQENAFSKEFSTSPAKTRKNLKLSQN